MAGSVERATFHNDDSGFCVLRIKARGHRELVTVIGHAAVISAGEWITASGEWINDRTHGQQFKAKFLKTSEPTSLDGIEKYLGSGMIRGIGPVYAKKLVRAFEKVFDTIEAEPERLREVTGPYIIDLIGVRAYAAPRIDYTTGHSAVKRQPLQHQYLTISKTGVRGCRRRVHPPSRRRTSPRSQGRMHEPKPR